jgi:heme exporter protein D
VGEKNRSQRGQGLMYFDSFQALLTMNGHGIYVWPAYLITIVVIIAVLVAPVRRRNRLLEQLLAAELRRTESAAVSGVRGQQ